MRLGLCLLALAACAHGSNGDVDAAVGGGSDSTVEVPPDSGCGALPCEAIYVARTGGSDTNAGTKQAPLKTIGAGITKAAAANPPLAVFVGGGTYNEALAMKSGVTVYG